MTQRTFLAVRWYSILTLLATVALTLFACSGSDDREDPIATISSSSIADSSSSGDQSSSSSDDISSSSYLSSGNQSSNSNHSTSSSTGVSPIPPSPITPTPPNPTPVVPSPSSSSVAKSSSSSVSPYGTPKPAKNFTFDDIQYWVGSGTNKAMLIVQWNDGKKPDALAWGYKWNGTKHGIEMLDDIAKADNRLFYLRYDSGYLGYAVAGIGFDVNGDAKVGNDSDCKSPVDGSIDAGTYDFDNWKLCTGTNARWGAGWYDAYWSYWVAGNIEGKWEYSGLGASSRELKNNSVDAWYFDLYMNDPDISTFHRCMEEPDNCDGRNYFGAIAPVSEMNP